MESNSVCNHTSDNKIGRPRSGSPICLFKTAFDSSRKSKKGKKQSLDLVTKWANSKTAYQEHFNYLWNVNLILWYSQTLSNGWVDLLYSMMKWVRFNQRILRKLQFPELTSDVPFSCWLSLSFRPNFSNYLLWRAWN